MKKRLLIKYWPISAREPKQMNKKAGHSKQNPTPKIEITNKNDNQCMQSRPCKAASIEKEFEI